MGNQGKNFFQREDKIPRWIHMGRELRSQLIENLGRNPVLLGRLDVSIILGQRPTRDDGSDSLHERSPVVLAAQQNR